MAWRAAARVRFFEVNWTNNSFKASADRYKAGVGWCVTAHQFLSFYLFPAGSVDLDETLLLRRGFLLRHLGCHHRISHVLFAHSLRPGRNNIPIAKVNKLLRRLIIHLMSGDRCWSWRRTMPLSWASLSALSTRKPVTSGRKRAGRRRSSRDIYSWTSRKEDR